MNSAQHHQRVTVKVEDSIAHVALARPDKLNGLDLAMIKQLIAAARQIRRDRSIRAVVLSGEGDAFCAGLDFAAVGKQPAAVARAFAKVPRLQRLNTFQRVCWVWRELPVPVVAVLCWAAGDSFGTNASSSVLSLPAFGTPFSAN